MDIKGTGRIGRSGVGRTGKPGAQAQGGFTVSGSEPARAQSVSGPGPIAALDSILALQGVEDAAHGRSKGLAHGKQLLDMLDEVRDGLLSGALPRTTLSRLAHAVSQRQDGFSDPRLQSVLDEIELRARVELAKLEQADRAAA